MSVLVFLEQIKLTGVKFSQGSVTVLLNLKDKLTDCQLNKLKSRLNNL